MSEFGYIYVRNHESYNIHNVCKLGKTNDIIARDSTYATGEFIRGKFDLILKIINIDMIERLLQREFKQFHIKSDGGNEFFKKDIISLIIPYLNDISCSFEIVNFDNLVRLPSSEFKLKPHQNNIYENIINFYKKFDTGKLIWACGLGKTLMAIKIAQLLKVKLILVGVPTKYLQYQMKREILNIYGKNVKVYIDNFNVLSSDIPQFYITTYISAGKYNCYNTIFDFKIGDEMHHLASSYKDFPKIQTKYTLYMTATEKEGEFQNFGELIDKKTIKWAIENKYITDYNILLLRNTESEIDNIITNLDTRIEHKNLFMAAYSTVRSLNITSHVLIYTNSINSANIIKSYVDTLLSKFCITSYNQSLHSETKNIRGEIFKFSQSMYGIISCVYLFGEGFDLPILNGVTFAENMQSEIRIIQSALRSNRLNILKPDKISHIIIPYIDDFEKCKTILSQMRIEDENIMCKISTKTFSEIDNKQKIANKYYKFELLDDKNELEKIQLKMRMGKYLHLTDYEYEYNITKLQNFELNIKIRDDRDIYFKKLGVWTNWYDFLNIDTSDFPKSKDEWLKLCYSYNIKTLDQYNQKRTKKLPEWPSELYKDFGNITGELVFKARR